MRYNNRTNMPVEEFLGRVHNAARIKYIDKQIEDKEIAQKLQDFFRALKDAAAGKTVKENDIFDQAIIEEILKTTNELLANKGLNPHLKSRGVVTQLFRRTGASYRQGLYFEQELEAVFQAVLQKALGENIKLDTYEISTGQKTGTTTITQELEEELKEGIAQGLSEEKIFKNSNEALYLKRVQIKTDIQGVNIDVKAILNSKFQEIQELLNNVTISAKSYRSQRWVLDPIENVRKLQEIYPTIHLGKALNPYRAIYGVLKDLGYNHSTAQSAFYAGKNMVQKGNQNVINHMYHLKFIYELTGAGTIVLGSTYNNVRFLVYNDPATDNIYVESAASILSDVFDENLNWTGDPLGAITISASRFE